MNAIVLCVSFAAIFLQVQANISPAQQQEILNAHNEKRQLVPEGNLVMFKIHTLLYVCTYCVDMEFSPGKCGTGILQQV